MNCGETEGTVEVLCLHELDTKYIYMGVIPNAACFLMRLFNCLLELEVFAVVSAGF